jgi:putative transposase
MPRPIKPELAGGLYHVTSFGIEERKLFPNDQSAQHFLKLLADMIGTYGVEVHGYLLLDDIYRLLVRTPSPNLKQFVHRLNVTYTSWFNRSFGGGGSVFGERLQAILVEPGEHLLRLSRHFHLAPIQKQLVNPVKLNSVGSEFFAEESVQKRIQSLREYAWSSYRAYAGFVGGPEWLSRNLILGAAMATAIEPDASPEKNYRAYVERAARMGLEEDILNKVRKRLYLGGDQFVARVAGTIDKQARGGGLAARQQVSWDQIVQAVEKVKGRQWDDFSNEYGDPGRDLALYAARKLGGYTLRELGERVGGIGLTAVGQAVTRFERQLNKDLALRRQFTSIQKELSTKQ